MITVDSTADLPRELAEHFDIRIIPLRMELRRIARFRRVGQTSFMRLKA